jgi:hypothetical protein
VSVVAFAFPLLRSSDCSEWIAQTEFSNDMAFSTPRSGNPTKSPCATLLRREYSPFQPSAGVCAQIVDFAHETS